MQTKSKQYCFPLLRAMMQLGLASQDVVVEELLKIIFDNRLAHVPESPINSKSV